ncbi:MAG: efflux RND transporter periplasmic adaptor subunit [Alicyclobacillus sp.]|nr:efflux RND transporter periplasmic adaptor subunit [Alicyclobacillus sp.]
MNVRRIVLLNIIALLVIVGVVYGGWHWYYQRTHYVSTDNAFVEGDEYPLNVEIPGTLTSWTVQNGDTVTAGQVLGQVDTSAELQQLGAAAKSPQVAKAVSAAADVTSPINGTILNSSADAGEPVAPGQPVGYVVNLNKLYIVANFQETQLQHIAVGDSVDIYIDAFPGQTFTGTVQSIGLATNSMFSLLPSTDATSGSYTKVTQTVPVRIQIADYAGNRLVPGMSATVRVHRVTD